MCWPFVHTCVYSFIHSIKLLPLKCCHSGDEESKTEQYQPRLSCNSLTHSSISGHLIVFDSSPPWKHHKNPFVHKALCNVQIFPGGGGSIFSEAELLGLKTLDFRTLGLYCQISPKHLIVVSYLLAVNQSVFFPSCA